MCLNRWYLYKISNFYLGAHMFIIVNELISIGVSWRKFIEAKCHHYGDSSTRPITARANSIINKNINVRLSY